MTVRACASVKILQAASSGKHGLENRSYRPSDFKSATPLHRKVGHLRINADADAIISESKFTNGTAGYAQTELGKTLS